MNRAPVCLSILWMVSGCTFVPPEPEPAPIEPINLSENASAALNNFFLYI